ncbi:hypothetical protein J4Q44_G00255460 [Coregonus suidteri]|uniref:C2H2-type domain-containing protein n=1 Tax=Coregonus suidteri TaxID=861788 RepID=A0AAN8L1M9_9TELE
MGRPELETCMEPAHGDLQDDVMDPDRQTGFILMSLNGERPGTQHIHNVGLEKHQGGKEEAPGPFGSFEGEVPEAQSASLPSTDVGHGEHDGEAGELWRAQTGCPAQLVAALSPPKLFNFRSPPPSLSDAILRKGKDATPCRYCGKIFPRSANLTRHLRTHTGEQPYRCKYCDRSFSISSNLQRHVRNIHNKEKPFKCHLCNRCFGQQTNLDRHLKKHEHENLPVSQHSGILSNLGTNISSPNSEPDNHGLLNEKEDSYFSEIRNFISKSEMNQASSSTDKRSELAEEERPSSHGLSNSKMAARGLEEEEAEGEDEEEEEGSLTEKSQDEAPESPSPITMVTPGAYEDEEEEAEEEEEATPLAMSYEHTPQVCPVWCIEEDGGLLDQEALPSFPKGLDLHKANSGEEPPFDVKDIFNTASLESEALKETLYRQAKTQAYAMMLSLSENNPLHASSQNSLDAWLSMGGGPAETSSFYPLNHI